MLNAELEEFQKNIVQLEGSCRKLNLEGKHALLLLTVKPEPSNFTLTFKVSDVLERYWQVRWGLRDFVEHQRSMRVMQNDWAVYFTLLKTAVTSGKIELRLEGSDLAFVIHYAVGETTLRGECLLKAFPERSLIVDLVFDTFDSLTRVATQSLKRPRSPSPQQLQSISSQPPPKKPKLRPTKKKPTKIGSKLV
mmetsp:Transcript_14889/g.27521  ORF Transcript_14889/g.27521 Transcript_14889/m.27521 type:complete len:193 (-) Transcript_14889:271-849(-)